MGRRSSVNGAVVDYQSSFLWTALSNPRTVVEKFHTIRSEFEDDDENLLSTSSTIDAEIYAGLIPLEKQGERIEFLLRKWSRETLPIKLSRSTFADLLEKRRVILQYLLQNQHSSCGSGSSSNEFRSLSVGSSSMDLVPQLRSSNWTKIPGSDPALWPDLLDSFLENIGPIEILYLRNEPDEIAEQFFSHALRVYHDHRHDLKLKKRMLVACIAFMTLHGSLYCLLEVLKLLVEFESDHPGTILPPMPACVNSLRFLQSEFDFPLPWTKSIFGSWSESANGSKRDNMKGRGLATNGTFLFIHNGYALYKIGSGFNGSVQGQIYAVHKGYRARESVALAFFDSTLIAMSSHSEWPFADVIDCSDLSVSGFLQFGSDPNVDVPEKKSDLNPLVISDGQYAYLFDSESSTKADSSNDDKASSTKTIVLYVYSMQEKQPGYLQTPQNSQNVGPKNMAAVLWKATGYRYTLSQCTIALKSSKDDPNAATKWLLNHGITLGSPKIVQCVRRLILNSSEIISLSMLSRSLVYSTGIHLVIVVPPYTADYNDSNEWAAKVFNLSSGELVVQRTGLISAIGPIGCYDDVNDLIWNCHFPGSINFQFYRNHGPRRVPLGSSSFLSQLALESVMEEVASVDRTSCLNLSTFLLAHSLRLLKQRTIVDEDTSLITSQIQLIEKDLKIQSESGNENSKNKKRLRRKLNRARRQCIALRMSALVPSSASFPFCFSLSDRVFNDLLLLMKYFVDLLCKSSAENIHKCSFVIIAVLQLFQTHFGEIESSLSPSEFFSFQGLNQTCEYLQTLLVSKLPSPFDEEVKFQAGKALTSGFRCLFPKKQDQKDFILQTLTLFESGRPDVISFVKLLLDWMAGSMSKVQFLFTDISKDRKVRSIIELLFPLSLNSAHRDVAQSATDVIVALVQRLVSQASLLSGVDTIRGDDHFYEWNFLFAKLFFDHSCHYIENCIMTGCTRLSSDSPRSIPATLRSILPCIANVLNVVMVPPKLCLNLLSSIAKLALAFDKINRKVTSSSSEDNRHMEKISNEVPSKIVVESSHPYSVGSNVVRETVFFGNYDAIALTFDPRCCSKDPMDQLMLYTDVSMTCRAPVGPFFGNEPDNNSNWPKHPIIVYGSTLSLNFSAKSQPLAEDRNRWGFKCILRGLSFHALSDFLDIESDLCAAAGAIFTHLIHGAPISQDEVMVESCLRRSLICQGLEKYKKEQDDELIMQSIHENSGINDQASPAESLIHSIIDEKSSPILAELQKHSYRFFGTHLIKKLPQVTQAEWNRCIRTAMACMIKHSGLIPEILQFIRLGGRTDSNSDSIVTLQDKLGIISLSAQRLQDWMLQEVQAVKRWKHLVSSPPLTESLLEEEFGNPEHFSTLIAVCHFTGVEHSLLFRDKPDLPAIFKALLEKAAGSSSATDNQESNPYRQICQHIQQTCEELLAFRGPFDAADSSDSGLDVPDIWRSRSVASHLNEMIQSPIFRTHSVPSITNSRDAITDQADKLSQKGFESRIQNFRHVVQTYQHWKAWQKIATPSRSAVQEQVLPFEAVADIIRRRFPANLLTDVAHTQEKRLIYRIAALRLVSDLLNNLSFSSAKLGIVGRLAKSLKSPGRHASLNFGVACCSPALSSDLLNAYELYFGSVASLLVPANSMGILQLHAVKDLFDYEFGIEYCRSIDKCSTLQIACDLLLHLCSNSELRVKQRLLFQSLWSGFRLLAFRIVKLGASDIPSHFPLPEVFIDLKKLQRTVFQLMFRLLRHFLNVSTVGANLVYVNRSLEKVLSFLVVSTGYSNFSLLNRNEYLQAFTVVIQNPCRFSLCVTRLAIRLAQTILPVVSVASTLAYFPSSLPTMLINTISNLIICDYPTTALHTYDYCIVAHRSEDVHQSRWIEILSNELPELVMGCPPADDPSARLADEMHNEIATAEFKARSKFRSGSAMVSLKEIGGGSIQFLSENAIVCKDGFATVVGEVSVNGGKWYFEMHLQSAGVMQIGWSMLDIMASSSAGNGIGDDRKSWAYDGRRLSKWHGEQSRYSNKRWQIGDVVGVAIDLDDKVMRYFLNGEDLGAAFTGFDLSESPSHAVRPSCSFASGERARFVFSASQFRCSMPSNHFPLQGDKPMPKNNPIGRAHSITCDLDQLGLAMIWRDTAQGCYQMASALAAKSVTVTVLNLDAFESIPSADPPDHATADTNQKFIFGGHQASAAASEYIALARFLLIASLSSKAWAESMRSLLSSILDRFCSDTSNDSSRMREVLGAISVLGGFSEPLRVGALADVIESSAIEHHCIVFDYSPGNSFAQIAMSRQGALKDLRLGLSNTFDPAADPNQTSQLLHRIRIDRLKTCPLFEVDLGSDFPLSKSNVSCLIALMKHECDTEAPQSFKTWLSLELSIRSCLVLEALLRSSTKADPGAVKLAKKHFVELAGVSLWRNFEFDRVRNVFERARERVYDLSSQCLGWFALPRIAHDTKTHAFEQLTLSPTVSLSDLQRRQSVYGSSAYIQESCVCPSEDTSIQRMLRYWELKIIPLIQDYVRGSFRDYEMVYFFEQLRQPLRAGDSVSAMKIVYTLCNQRVPETVQFPPLNRDWSELMCEDIVVGQTLVVGPAIRTYPSLWNEQLMQHIIGSVGVVQAIRSDRYLVLLQLFFEDRSVLESFWFPVSCLREPDLLDSSCSTENIDNIRRFDDAVDFLSSAVAPLPVLLARRSIISLCSQSSSFVREQLAKSSDLGSLLFASLSQCLQSTLYNAGVPLHEHAGTINDFELCLTEAISHVTQEIGSKIMQISDRSLSKAAEFSLSNTVICEKATSREFFVSGTSSFIIQFSMDSALPPNASFSIYADSECTRLIKSYSGGRSGVSNLQHCSVSGDRFWTRVALPADGTAITSFSLRATALSPDFALSFWIVRFLTNKDLPCLGKSRTEIMFQFVERIFVLFNLVGMNPSPMKESILGLIFDLIKSVPADLKSGQGVFPEQIIVSLDYIARLQPELIRLLASESLTGQFTSYLQLLLDLQITADDLRSSSARVADRFTPLVDDQDTDSTHDASANTEDGSWICPICTLMNESSVHICSACEGPRPHPEQKPKSCRSTADLSPNSRDRVLTRATLLFNKICGLVDIMRWLYGRSISQLNPPVRAIVESAWNRARSERLEPQLFIIDDLPVTGDDADAPSRLLSLIAEISASSDVPFLVQHDSVFIGTDTDRPEVPTIQDAAVFLTRQAKTLQFEHEYPMDENGLIWYLGTKGNSELFSNPMTAGLVTVRASSLQHDSVGAEAVVGRDVVRCVTTSSERQWFEIDFHQTRVCPSHYTLRHYISWHTEALRSWRFEALSDSGSWLCLHEAFDDESLSAKGAAATFKVAECIDLFSRFRVLMTGENSNRHLYLALSGFEIYGDVISDTIQRKLPIRESNRFAVISLLNLSEDSAAAFMKELDGIVIDWPGWFRTKLSVTRFESVPRTDNRIVCFVRSRLVDKSGQLTETFSRAVDDLFKIPAVIGELLPDSDSELGQFIESEIGDGVIDSALLKSVLRKAALSSNRVVQISDWLKALGYNLDVTLIVENSFDKALQDSSLWSTLPNSAHEEFMEHLHNVADRIACTDILQLPLNRITCSESELLGLRKLIPISEAVIRLRFAVLKEFNESINDLLPLADLRYCDGNRLGGLLRQCRHFIFRSVKQDFLFAITDLTAESGKRPPILSFNRLELASRDRNSFDFIHDTFFGNAYLQLRDLSPSDLKPPRPHGTDPFLAFEVVFHGEDVVGEGGPYRQFFSDISNELLSSDSPLFIPCPNQQGGIGENQDTFVIRPSASTSSSTLSLFEFFGQILGICLRTGVRISLRLPAFVWKPIVCDPILPSDLSTIDHQTSMVLQLVQSIDEELFGDMIEETFSTPLSDRTVALLRPNGDKERVTFSERYEYIRLVHNARFNEAQAQIDAIRRGINKIVPVQLLNIFLHHELELLVNGKQEIDIDMLRRHTKYSGVPADSPHIRYFWEVLAEFSQQERRKFIRFAWAQEKLPVDDAEFVRTHTRLLIKTTSSSAAPDSRFPRTDTCFFNLELPAYSSKEILHKRLLFAITHTDSMNADVVPEDHQVSRHAPDFSNLMP